MNKARSTGHHWQKITQPHADVMPLAALPVLDSLGIAVTAPCSCYLASEHFLVASSDLWYTTLPNDALALAAIGN